MTMRTRYLKNKPCGREENYREFKQGEVPKLGTPPLFRGVEGGDYQEVSLSTLLIYSIPGSPKAKARNFQKWYF
jgi:hypothetical protein